MYHVWGNKHGIHRGATLGNLPYFVNYAIIMYKYIAKVIIQ